MTGKTSHCLVCGKPDPGEDTICSPCKALIRGEAIERHKAIKKDADQVLHKEGTEVLMRRPSKRAA